MSRPVLQNVGTFDATKSKMFRFQWYGSALNECKLSIYNSATDVRAYEAVQTVIDSVTAFTLPANTLTNGISYYAMMYAYDAHGNESTASNTIQFDCVMSPDFELDIEDDIELDTTTLELNIEFDHESDSLKTLKFYLLDENGKTLAASNEILYETVNDGTYRFLGLENNTTYKTYASCTTVNGFELETEIRSVYINCESPDYGGECSVECNEDGGYVKCSTAFVVIQYNGDKNFTYSNSMIDLSNDTMYYDEGFEVSGDFRLCLKGKGFKTEKFFTASHGKENDITMSMKYYDDDTVQGYKIRLAVTHGKLSYILYSNRFDVNDDEPYYVWLTRKNHIYKIEVTKEESA